MDATDLNKFVACLYKWLGGTCYKERMNNIAFYPRSLSPLPVGLEFPRVLISGIKQLRIGKKRVFFSNRLPRKMAEKYLQKLCTEESEFTIETSKKALEEKG